MTTTLAELRRDRCLADAEVDEALARSLRLSAAICIHADSYGTDDVKAGMAAHWASHAEAATQRALRSRAAAVEAMQ